MTNRGYKYRIYAGDEVESFFARCCGIVRLVYNVALEQRSNHWRQFRRSAGMNISLSVPSERIDGHPRRVSVGIVNPDDVDWHVTISINARMEEEKEIRVKESAFITVVSATWVPPYGRGEEITEEFSAVLPAGSEAASRQTGVLTPA